MSAPKKPRSDAPLKTLPAERQLEIIEKMGEPGMSLAKVCSWLRDDGFDTSPPALSRFREWWLLQQQLSENEATVTQLMGSLSKENPTWSPAKIQETGQAFFTAMALQARDPKQWFFIQKLALQKQQLAFERDKFEFDAAKACLKKLPELKVISTDRSLTEPEKVEQIRLKLFGVVPA